MQSSESIAKLAPALVAIHSELSAVGKSGENKFDKYSYANLEDYVRAVKPVLAKHKCAMVAGSPNVTHLQPRQTKSGGSDNAVDVEMSFRIIHESGEWIETSMHGEGQDRADKATYKAYTGARKYAIASMLNLATTDDPEADETVGQGAASNHAPQNGSGGTPADPPAKAKPVIAAFKAIGVSLNELEAYLGKLCGGWKEKDYESLRAHYQKCEAQNKAAIAAGSK